METWVEPLMQRSTGLGNAVFNSRNIKISSHSGTRLITKVFFALMSAVLLSFLSTSTAQASETFSCGNGATYTITDGVVGSGSGCSGAVTLDSTAIKIGSYAFYDSQVTSLTLSNSVTEIEWGAFYYMPALKTLNISSSVTTISASAFDYTLLTSIVVDPANQSFSSADGVLFNKNKTELVIFPSGKDASSWSIPAGVTKIGRYAFNGVTTIKNFVIPEGVTHIEYQSFRNCENLETISIPSTVNNIENPGMLSYYNKSLTHINVAPSNLNFASVDGILFNKAKTALLKYPDGKVESDYVLPSTVFTISEYAFSGNQNLKNLQIGNQVTTLGSAALYDMKSLETVYIPAALDNLPSIELLVHLTPKLTSITVDSANPILSSVDGVLFNKNKTVLYRYPSSKAVTSYVIPSTVTTINTYSFANAKLTSVTIPSSVLSIKYAAFNGSNLQSVVIPDGVTEIETYAFSAISSLKRLALPNSLTLLSANAFSDNGALRSFSYCGSSLTQSVLTEAGLSGKVNVCGKEVPGAPTNVVASVSGATSATVSFTAPASDGGSAITSYTATATPGGLTGTVEQAGSGSVKITGLNPSTAYTFTVVATNFVGDSVASTASEEVTTDQNSYILSCGVNATYTITDGVVRDAASCTGELILSSKARKIGAYAFNGGQITSITIPLSVTELEYSAFYGASLLTSINLPKSIETISDTPFMSTNLSSITVDPANLNYSSKDGVLYNKNQTSLIAYPSAKDASSWSIPSTVKSIAAYALHNISTLKKLEIPVGVTDLGYAALGGSPNLTEISISSTVTNIANPYSQGTNSPLLTRIIVSSDNPNYSSVDGVLFDKDRKILIRYPQNKSDETYVIPSTVTSIGETAFYGASHLKSITIGTNVESIGYGAFISMEKLEIIQIASGVNSISIDYNFFDLPKLTAINVAANSQYFTSDDGVLFNKDKSIIIHYPASRTGTSYVIPSTVTTIANRAFSSALITSITIPNGVTSIGEYSFYFSRIGKVTIPNSVTSIAWGAFQYMSSLKSLTISENLTTLGGYAFSNNDLLRGYAYCGTKVSQELLSGAGLSDKVNVCGKEVPGSPTVGAVKLTSGGTAAITFTAPISDGGSAVTSYTAIAMPGGLTGTIEQSGSGTIEISGLKPITTYTFTVVATNLVGDSNPSAVSQSLTTKNLPGVPTISAAIVNGATKALVNITAPASDGGSSITRYTAIASPGGARGDLFQAGSGTIEISGLEPETTYKFTVFAVNDLGESESSVESEAITTDARSYTFACGKNTTYTITDGVVRDGGNCSGDLVLSNKARVIGSQAFVNSKVSSITIPNTVTEFEFISFMGMLDLRVINIPSSVIKIGELAFIITNISSFTVDPANPVFSSVDGVLYNKDKTKLVRFPVSKSIGSWSIPDGVTEIGSGAFAFVHTLTNLVIPEGVKTVGSDLLQSTGNLTKISIPSTLTEFIPGNYNINNEKFSEFTVAIKNPNYAALDGVLYNKDLTTLISFPSGKNLKSFVIPSTVQVISRYAFIGNKYLTNLSLGEKVTTIEMGAFQGMSSLSVLNIPASVTSIVVPDLFSSGMSPTINIHLANPNYSSIDGVLYNKNKSTLLLYPSSKIGETFTVPSSVNTINFGAFASSKLTNVIIPNSVTTIDDYAFTYMNQLRKITLSDNLTSIGAGAFSGSNNLLSYIYCGSLDVTLPGKPNGCGKALPEAPIIGAVTTEGPYAVTVPFTAPISDGGSPVVSYTAVSTPGGLTGTTYQATSGNIQVSGLTPKTSYTFKVFATNAAGDSVASVSSASVTTDDYKLTINCGLNATYTIINGVAGNGRDCSGDILLSSKAKEVGVDAFRGSKITSITMFGVKIINSGAFSETNLLKTITIPSSVTSINGPGRYLERGLQTWGPFDSSNIASINVDPANPEYSSLDGVLFSKDQTTLLRFPEGKDASKWSIPKTVTVIGDSAFLNVSTLTKLNIPEGVISIGYFITDSALNLVEVSIPSTLTKSDGVNRIIYNNPKLTKIEVSPENPYYTSVDGVLFNKDKTILERFPEGKDAGSWVIPSGVTSIGEYAFAYVNSLVKLQIPEGVLNIAANIADSAPNLKEITLPSSVTLGRFYLYGSEGIYYFLFNNPLWERITVAADNPFYTSIDGVLYNKDVTTLLRFPEGKSVNGWSMPSTVTTIGEDAFSQVNSLTTLELPEGVSGVNSGLAPWSRNLTEISIPSTTRLWSIRSSLYENNQIKAFKVSPNNPYYTSIDGVLYNKDVTTLLRFPTGKDARTWVFPTTVTEIGSEAFMGSNIQKLTVPKGVTTIGGFAFAYMHQLEQLSIPDSATLVGDQIVYDTRKLNGYIYCGTGLSLSQLAIAGFGEKINVCGKSAPSAPTVGVATATGTTTATVTFTASATAGSYPIDSYTATVMPSGVSVRVNPVSSGVFEFTGLTPATSYVFSIVATSLAGDSVASQTVTVKTNKMTAVIAAFENKTGLFAGSPITITAPASASAGAWSYASSDPSVVSVDGSSLVINKVGSVTITATQAATDSYLATTKTFTVTIDKATAVIAAFENKTGLFAGSPITITAPASASAGAWSYASSDPSVVSVDGSSLVINKVGSVTITATQAATDSYLATTKTFTVIIGALTPTLGVISPISVTFSTVPIVIVPPTSTSDGAWSYTLTDSTIGTITNGALLGLKAGTTTLTAIQAPTDKYLGTQFATTVVIKPAVVVTVNKRVISVSLKGAAGKVLINGKAAKIGKNTVTAGKKLVTVSVGGKEIYKKSFTIK